VTASELSRTQATGLAVVPVPRAPSGARNWAGVWGAVFACSWCGNQFSPLLLSTGHRRFVRVIAIAAPWLFASAAIGYGYLPTQLRGATGSWGLVFATAATVVALGVSSAIQPVAKRVHSLESARGLCTGVAVIAAGIAMTALAVMAQSPWAGLAANAVIGAGMGITMVSGLLEVQQIASPGDLAGASPGCSTRSPTSASSPRLSWPPSDPSQLPPCCGESRASPWHHGCSSWPPRPGTCPPRELGRRGSSPQAMPPAKGA
jgi:hypothetical protein